MGRRARTSHSSFLLLLVALSMPSTSGHKQGREVCTTLPRGEGGAGRSCEVLRSDKRAKPVVEGTVRRYYSTQTIRIVRELSSPFMSRKSPAGKEGVFRVERQSALHNEDQLCSVLLYIRRGVSAFCCTLDLSLSPCGLTHFASTCFRATPCAHTTTVMTRELQSMSTDQLERWFAVFHRSQVKAISKGSAPYCRRSECVLVRVKKHDTAQGFCVDGCAEPSCARYVSAPQPASHRPIYRSLLSEL